MRVWIRRRPFWWSAINPDEALALMDTHTTLRSRTREGVIEKARRYWGPHESLWEEITVAALAPGGNTDDFGAWHPEHQDYPANRAAAESERDEGVSRRSPRGFPLPEPPHWFDVGDRARYTLEGVNGEVLEVSTEHGRLGLPYCRMRWDDGEEGWILMQHLWPVALAAAVPAEREHE